MKKKWILQMTVAAALMGGATSCSEDAINRGRYEQTTGKVFTLQASYGTNTRTTLEPNAELTGYSTKWWAGDKIFVTDGTGLVSGVLTLEEGAGTTSGTFSGVVSGNSAALKYAVYPVPEDGMFDLSEVDAKSPNAPLTATIAGNKASFANACGLVRLIILDFPHGKTLSVSSDKFVTNAVLNESEGELTCGESETSTIEVKEANGWDAIFVPFMLDGEEATGDMTVSVNGASVKYENLTFAKGKVTSKSVYALRYKNENGVATLVNINDEGSGVKVVENQSELEEALTSVAANDIIALKSGDYIIPDKKNCTFPLNLTGLSNDVYIYPQNDGSPEGNCDYSFDGNTVTFNNVTIVSKYTYYPGYVRMKGTYNGCTVNGVYALYANSEFNDCTFNVSGDVYNIWTWGAAEATFTRCTFNSDGKAMLLYGTANTKLTINSSVFNDNGGLTDLKAAVEIGNDYDKSYELIVNNTVVNGYEINDMGINTGTTLWANKNSMGTDKLNVVVDGVDVY